MRRSLIRASLLAAEPRIEIVETQPGTWKVAAYPPLPIIHHCSHPPSSCPHRNAPLVKFYYEKPSMSEEIQRAKKLWEATVMQALPPESDFDEKIEDDEDETILSNRHPSRRARNPPSTSAEKHATLN